MSSRFRPLVTALAAAALLSSSLAPALACTRAVYIGSDDMVITGRTMDWLEDMHTRLWAFPRGIKRDGAAGPNAPVWTAKYGSVVASGYDLGTADGMNEAGLVANLLYLAESDYGTTMGKPPLSMSLWAQYVLDNFASVAEAVAVLEKEPFRVQTAELPNGKAAQLHLSISDATGDSAIFQYIGGRLVIYHGKEYRVMTNSPTYDQQLALNAYWKEIGGLTFLPGTNRAADRFARASFLIQAIPTEVAPSYIGAVPDKSFANQAVASVMGVMRSVSVPLGITTPGQPNISSTIWRTVAEQKDRVYFFDSSTSPNTFWVPLADLDLKEGAPVKMLDITGGRVFSGNAADKFVDTKPFTFMPVVPKE
ncbi:linear amide C-N hydrolase [Kaistia geumhonensis]|uniref:Choloylglycine hydrolase n=1 Tax=Kaistia geumhonensis TaxID=410839 RepID=A0ABU0M2X2_9HYPH|nr:linear amide C-N hydrolase [Kaistia geumhonensis]MCX5479482.1 linear amide C-N hydrolase [Kaistia geumhonensis]MDQ0515294.1 choloylglycine hydrolase [Kaistia geumhonensis]